MSCSTLLRPAGLVTGPLSHVVVPAGVVTIYVGGQNGVDATGAVVAGDVTVQTRQVFTNIATALAAAGAELADVVSLSILLVDGADLHAAAAAGAEALADLADPPLVTVALVSGLAVPGALVEVTALAAVQR
ncbi:Rid family hydrolase [Pseudokineococcus sp. 1T1Z-3]|uniref:Rid family hydrolase n=1 Tax=Pseudokineococcus sp. 1T1Z-3 TaxID=3132745 RepID=UPI0030A0B281